MTRSPARDQAALLFANETFYRAFAERDTALMNAVWAEHEPVTCLHPGWPPVEGRDNVLQSWHAILTGPASPDIECLHARGGIHKDTGIVICYERIGQDFLIATNIFIRSGDGWLLVHHQSGAAPEPAEGTAPPKRSIN
ncbi:nuclear transport factor 2 family protein [Parvibaculum sp.]|uniref:nuclear transport factor 2 family protein n=1 Tax=Parvibaculum sp. TaxID=2024848 RepID=UPI001B1D4EBF|nr:nuclear transport factor 2 family protein [Parvibaculum sp.]MBO6635623.1 nuclear transport factor 2 family protein [Parvibaculum sp.]MBO6679817.1 nuclear transport factor 2 family protein [Parvibaculum sp.]MBO6683822.1 nuclear transport factor 2 family protein [Parvibaculum sp.]MBO6905755.1 nuclear transport factor 2 family protein [Parvibaculum sp.]